MNAGIIAAGDGTRLAAAWPGTPKPLVPVAGFPLIGWTARGLLAGGAQRIAVLLNSKGRNVKKFLKTEFKTTEWEFLEADTASSWESFRLVATTLSDANQEPFLISTVDCLLPPGAVARFVAGARGAAALALTTFIDDEKPLWADLEADGRISALGPDARRRRHATAGLYRLGPDLAGLMPPAAAFPNLRSYWRSVVASGTPVTGVDLGKTMDVDRPEDLRAAEDFLLMAAPNDRRKRHGRAGNAGRDRKESEESWKH